MGKAFIHGRTLVPEKTQMKKQASSVLRVILGVSFLFGIVHALGPGHRKTVVFSLYVSRSALGGNLLQQEVCYRSFMQEVLLSLFCF